MAAVRSLVAHVVVVVLLAAVIGCVRIADGLRWILRREPRVATPGGVHLMLTGTFYNRGWFRSHIMPLADSSAIDRITVVCDRPLFDVPKVTYVTPQWWARPFGRTCGRLLTMWWAAWHEPPHVVMGYHIMPNALLSLLVGHCFGSKTVYQMTGGPVQIEGGGHGSENVLLRQLDGPSPSREKLMFAVVRLFDWVVVRGRRGQRFLKERRIARGCAIIPGSVDCRAYTPQDNDKLYDLVSVGRLVPVKRYAAMLRIVAHLARIRPAVRAAIVGDGPQQAELEQLIDDLGIHAQVELAGQRDNVVDYLQRGRMFMMTSESEGLSIAMIEAMAVGLPAVVPDVGDLCEMVEDGKTGMFIDPLRVDDSAGRIVELLDDPRRLATMAEAARKLAVERVDIRAVAARWNEVFGSMGAVIDEHLTDSSSAEEETGKDEGHGRRVVV